ncbi:MAG: hypothetical protein ACKO5R_03575 [Planctomycetaceae bacterium]
MMTGRDASLRGRWAIAIALAAAVVAAGCSSKPAKKKKPGQAAAARQRAEEPLVAPAEAGKPAEAQQPAEPEATAPAGADEKPADPAAPTGALPPAAADDAAPASSAAPDTAPAGADPEPAAPASLSDLGPAAGAGADDRPTSPLVDAGTALVLDGGRVEVSSPEGWTRSPRSQKYLVRYQPGTRRTYPSIVVTAEPAPEGLGSVTADTVGDLVAAITARLAVDFPAGGSVKVIKRPAAARLGPHAGVAWAVPGTAKVDGLSEPIERFAWAVVLGGRLYVVEARAPKGKLDDAAKDRAKAVASTLFRPADAPEGAPEEAAPAAAAAADE